jgi:hypothetical protein
VNSFWLWNNNCNEDVVELWWYDEYYKWATFDEPDWYRNYIDEVLYCYYGTLYMYQETYHYWSAYSTCNDAMSDEWWFDSWYSWAIYSEPEWVYNEIEEQIQYCYEDVLYVYYDEYVLWQAQGECDSTLYNMEYTDAWWLDYNYYWSSSLTYAPDYYIYNYQFVYCYQDSSYRFDITSLYWYYTGSCYEPQEQQWWYDGSYIWSSKATEPLDWYYQTSSYSGYDVKYYCYSYYNYDYSTQVEHLYYLEPESS